MRISLIVARATNGVIGDQGGLPWKLPNDLKYFKQLTMGHLMLMGRKTLQSIGRLLPGRETIVMTRDLSFNFPGAHVVHDWQSALACAQQLAASADEPASRELFVVGGSEIYQIALPHADRIYLTEVDAMISGDTMLAPFDQRIWREVSRVDQPADEKNCHRHAFVVLDRRETSRTEAPQNPHAFP